MEMDMKSVGIDLGGTNLKLVLIDAEGKLLQAEQYPTQDADFSDWRDMVIQRVRRLTVSLPNEKFTMGLSAPGLADEKNESIAFMPGRLAGLEHFNWTAALGHDCPVINDAHAALIAESCFGAGRGCRHLVMLTLGTGIGGALLINGELHQGLMGRAGHLGHISMFENQHLDITQTPGSLEFALGNVYLSDRSYGKYKEAEQLIKDYRAGKPLASLVWLGMMRDLARGIISLVNAFAPEKVILGGGLTQANDDVFKPLQEFIDLFEWRPSGLQTPVVKARFETYSGAIGAAAFALQKQSKN